MPHTSFFSVLIPLLFVFLWSTGFIGAKFGLPYAEPITFLFIRMLAAALLLYLIVTIARASWPARSLDYLHAAIVGVLIHGFYLGGVFIAISNGMDAGLSALIVCLQPLLTVILALAWLRESLSLPKATGIVLGLAGVTLVILNRGVNADAIPASGLLLCFGSLFAISVGTIYQKRFCAHLDLLPSVCIQYVAAAAALLPLAAVTESMSINWTGEFILALSWLILALSMGAVLLFMWLIKRGNASNVASLFYLVPPFTAVEAFILFGESLTAMSVAGILLSVTGVAIVLRSA